uniref:C1q domain-containing protein n=1 Tax=Oncorhynchus tshawytscha TaxID=74940 RepID=A0A8C8H9U0_ONCTS
MKTTAFLMVSLSCGLSVAQDDTPMTEHEVECAAELQNSCYMLTLITEFGVMEEKQQTTVEKLQTTMEKLGVKGALLHCPERDWRNRALQPGTNLTYSKVIPNIGNAYHPHIGELTAPVRGVYYFSFFFHAGGSEDSHTSLFKNEECMPFTSDHKSSTDTADNGGNAVTLQLEVGDQVYIRLRANVTYEQSVNTVMTFSNA